LFFVYKIFFAFYDIMRDSTQDLSIQDPQIADAAPWRGASMPHTHIYIYIYLYIKYIHTYINAHKKHTHGHRKASMNAYAHTSTYTQGKINQ
jgi:hypothetical protein